jgi:hypothetical protein
MSAQRVAKAILTGRDQGAGEQGRDLASRYFTFNAQPGSKTAEESIRR